MASSRAAIRSEISFAGVGEYPPVAGVAPTSLAADLFTGESENQTLTVTNTGSSDLEFTAAAALVNSEQRFRELAEMLPGARIVAVDNHQPFLDELDRRAAICRAIELADDNSLILVAGKGHEATQTIGDRQIPFSDQIVIREEAGRAPCS